MGEFDALICTAGAGAFAPLSRFTEAEYETGLRSKLMGQVNLVTYGRSRLPNGMVARPVIWPRAGLNP
ncbi:hypothetical protein [Pararhodobacter sp. CCB-MM2]|uniref:hypothetical protein n=1 Tax=Pararhodobacter sp. CCB-MM2 TaxID=1786003 RepID=UPI000AC34007|nr:hypothetical protein [Pararhodobacter sp. CCB-MM2]